MVYHDMASYLWVKGQTYYFNRRVPKDVQAHYKASRIVICLKTSRKDQAIRAARSIAQRLEDYWLSLRLANIDVPALHLLRDRPLKVSQSSCMTLSEALELYLRLKGVNKGKVFRRGAERNIQSVVDVLSDRALDEYSSSDAAAYRDYLLKRGLTTNSVKRNFATIRSVINLAIQEHGLECRNAFSKVYLPDLDDAKKRKPIPIENIKEIQQECMSIDDEARWLVALISDTGMRLSEAAGLHIDDIKLDCEIPHIDLKPHAWRGLKTRGSQRQIPLVGASLWAAKRVKAANTTSPYAFPRYTSAKGTNANSASAAINKWLRPRVPEGCVIHSFRHSLRDRLRAVQCPSDMIDQIGGWTTAGVGQSYGEGYGLDVIKRWMHKTTN
ncbi:tyrosine-type recombinase/integrase [Alphaproteobacteria bacterium]|nr:tyrosine-type recombinase/integrase [Alphaproteobacteria bacterium]